MTKKEIEDIISQLKSYIDSVLNGYTEEQLQLSNFEKNYMNDYEGNESLRQSTFRFFLRYFDKGGIDVDGFISGTSTNPVENKAIYNALKNIVSVNTNKENFPSVGSNYTIYVDASSRKIYYWDGSKYVLLEIELGETEGTAYEGNKGKKNSDDIEKLWKDKISSSFIDDIVVLSQEEYDSIENKNKKTLYLIS